MKQDFQTKLDAFLEEYYRINQNSGCLRITSRDEVIFRKFMGYADREAKTPFTEHSVFSLYSLSKPFCAIGLMKLKDKGLVRLDDHPGVYLPEAAHFHQDVTLRHLLTHTSGIPDFNQNTDFQTKYAGETSQQLRWQLGLLADYGMLFQPGTQGHYTNTNFIISALIAEAVSGMNYADYMKAEVFQPLGMHSTRIDSKHLVLPDRVKGYNQVDGQIVCVERVTERVLGGADVISTVDDIYCLNKAIKHKLLLSDQSWNDILCPSPVNSMGLGCTISQWHGKKRITHNGGWDGYRTLHVQLPEDDFDIILLTNSSWGDARYDISEAIYTAYYGTENGHSDAISMDAGYL